MELWRWVQASPIVHLVSRRIPTSLPGFPNGLILHDAAITRSRLRGRSEDVIFAEDPRLIQKARRGLSFIEPIGGGEATVVRRGLPKFFDVDTACLADVSSILGGDSCDMPSRSQSQVAASKLFAASIKQATSSNALISVTRLQKANGENAQVSYHAATGQWVLCSKNVSILASCASELELPQWADRRYRFARQVAALWFLQLSALEESSCGVLKDTLASRTLIGEMVGGSGAHLVQYGPDRKLQWFAIVPHQGDEACWLPSLSSKFFHKIGLPTVEFGQQEVYATAATFLEALRKMVMTVEKTPLNEAGEGYVLYITAGSTPDRLEAGAKVIYLGKLKTAEYRVLRRMRDKAKHFAKSAGCLLVEDVLEDFKREATMLEDEVVQAHATALGKLCRLIFAEDTSVEEVDEKFLDLLQRAQSYEGTNSPRKPAPAVCLVAPPFALDAKLAMSLQALLDAKGQIDASAACKASTMAKGTDGRCFPSEIHRENLASAWHASTSSKAKVYLNHIPIGIEGLFAVRDCEPAQKRRRLDVEERRNHSSLRLAETLGQRCIFILWGWSGIGDQNLSSLKSDHLKDQSPMERRLLRSKHVRESSRVFFQKLHAQAESLKAKLPSAQTLWLPGLPSVGDQRAMSTIATSIEQAWAKVELPNLGRELQWQEASMPSVIVIIPVALPGMGKSSLLEALFRRCQQGEVKCYRQGKLVKSSQSIDPKFNTLSIRPSSAAIVSSDGFTGEELELMGLTATGSSSQDVARCRRRAADKYRKAVEDFLRSAAESTEKVHLLLLDKNHPPSGLRNEVDVLQSACKSLGCGLIPKALAIDFVDAGATSDLENELLKEEEKHFGPWAYPWNPNVMAECGARLLLRSSHDTLAGGETSLFVLLSFLRLHNRFELDEASVGIPLIKTPYLSTTGELASWAPSPSSESIWCRFEVRALLQQILSLLQKPFENQQKLKPLLASLVLQLRSSGLQIPDEMLRQKHTESCAEGIWTEIFKPVASLPELEQPQYFSPSFRYVALNVDAHHAVLDSLLSRVSLAIRAVTDLCIEGDEPFQSVEFRRPKSLHVTTCYLGTSSTVSDAQRTVVAASKSLVAESTTFDCSITHLVAAPGALAFAVVDGSRLRAHGVPMAEEQRPHITMCTQLPWQPRHSNEVLEAVTPWLEDASVHAAGKWVRNVKVKSAVLDVFILQLERPVVLPSNDVQLY